MRYKNYFELFQGLRKSFKNKTVVNDINMMVERGEIFGILGPNGAGKTTILSMITADLHPDKGKVVNQTFVAIIAAST